MTINYRNDFSSVSNCLKKGVFIFATVCGASTFTNAVVAQTEGSDLSDGLSIEEIIVTAQRRSENLQSAPLAITAIGEEELRRNNIESLFDIGALSPNVMVGSQSLTGSNSGGFFIRGIGQDRSGVDFDQGVGLYVDGVFVSRSDNSFLSIVDVERIEILRGPQGTLFGKNTIGGAINYITKQPGEEFGGYVDVTLGRYNRADIKGSVNVPLSDSVFVKATAGILTRDGFLDHVIDGDKEGDMDNKVARLQLRALLTDGIILDLSVSNTQSENSGRAFIVDFIDPNDFAIGRLNSKGGGLLDESFVSPDSYTRYGGDNTYYDYDGTNISAILTADISDTLEFKSITAYMEADVVSANDWDGTNLNVFDIVDTREFQQFSQELQLSGTAFEERLKFVTGLYYLTEEPGNSGETTAGFIASWPTPRLRTIDSEVKSYAAFTQGTYSFTDALDVTLGIRYSKDEKTVATFQNIPGTGAGTGTISNGDSGEWDDVSSRLAVEYQWSNDVMTYASATKGFRSGGINAGFSTTVFTQYDPEYVWNYEVGVRAELLENRLRTNVTIFDMDYEDQQLTAFDAALNRVFIQNVGTSSRTGIELEFQAVVTAEFSINGSYGYLDAEYDDVGAATGVTEDSRVLRSPKQTYAISANYETDLGEGQLAANLNYSYRSKQSTTSTDGNSVLLDGYGLSNARLTYSLRDWTVAAYVTNLADKEYFIGGFDFARTEGFIGVSQLDVGRPREYGINVKYDF